MVPVNRLNITQYPMPGPTVPPGGIYAGLFRRGDGTFHWTIIISQDAGHVVNKFHATEDSRGWRFEYSLHTIVRSVSACAVVKIGTLSSNRLVGDIHTLLKDIPMQTPVADLPQSFSCRIWFKEAVRVLSNNGIIRCPAVSRLEAELKGIAREQEVLIGLGYDYKIFVSDYSQ
ncbi:hypothetical protein SCP_0302410 [Sparassis crispa]|uniref:Uncharacterized protein n=1 Tax=Sparassis crispa TaxID=139825 RepID=A0A401GEC3_9APHY|nr:hypothetical protein SCP_0302410 [Sparassis crispa]GBE80526.1 hypothetical protein SCP_0302410 [Sparassis crispa]